MYYKMGHERGERGNNPLAEAQEHEGFPKLGPPSPHAVAPP
jgi:hypothetical protein